MDREILRGLADWFGEIDIHPVMATLMIVIAVYVVLMFLLETCFPEDWWT